MQDQLSIAFDNPTTRSQSQVGSHLGGSQMLKKDTRSKMLSIINLNPSRNASVSSVADLRNSATKIDENLRSNSGLHSRGGLMKYIEPLNLSNSVKSDLKSGSPYTIVRGFKEKLKQIQLRNEDSPMICSTASTRIRPSPRSKITQKFYRSQSQENIRPETVLAKASLQVSLAIEDSVQHERKKENIFRISHLVDPHNLNGSLQLDNVIPSTLRLPASRTNKIGNPIAVSAGLSSRKYIQTPEVNIGVNVNNAKESNPRQKSQHAPARHLKSEKPLLSKYFGSDKINHTDLAKFASQQLQSVKKTIKSIDAKKLPFYYAISEDPTISLKMQGERRRSLFNENLIRIFYENAKRKKEDKQKLMEKILQQRMPEDYTTPAILRAGRKRRKAGILGEMDFSEKKVSLEEKVVDPVDEMKDRDHNNMLKITVLQIAAPTNPLTLKGTKPVDEKLLSVLMQGTKKIRLETQKDFKRIRQNLIEALRNMARLGLKSEDIIGRKQVFSKVPFQKKYSKEFIDAVKVGDLDMVEYFIKFETRYLVYDFDYCHLTGLHWAIKRGNLKIVKLLLQFHADFEARDMIGRTPLYFALKHNQIEIVKLLLYYKADPWSPEEFNYTKLCRGRPYCRYYLKKSRQIHIMLAMTPPSARANLWEKQRLTFLLDPESHIREDLDYDRGFTEDQ